MAGPPGFEPGTYGFLPCEVKSPPLYLAELRAHKLIEEWAILKFKF